MLEAGRENELGYMGTSVKWRRVDAFMTFQAPESGVFNSLSQCEVSQYLYSNQHRMWVCSSPCAGAILVSILLQKVVIQQKTFFRGTRNEQLKVIFVENGLDPS